MNLSVTGTRHGTTPAQRQAFLALLNQLAPTRLAHGSCRGADVEAAHYARAEFGSAVRIVAYPGPDGDPWRTDSGVDDEVMPPKTHFARNRDLVAACDVLVAFPPCRPMPEQGGTRYTHDQGVKQRRRVIVIWPDGETEEHNL
jgi:hypothetical protein